jgi:hypothetical protein
MIVGERTLRNKIPETLKSGCLGAQRLVVPASSRLRGAGWLRRYFPAVPKAINKPKTNSVGFGLVKPVAAYGAKKPQNNCAITA